MRASPFILGIREPDNFFQWNKGYFGNIKFKGTTDTSTIEGNFDKTFLEVMECIAGEQSRNGKIFKGSKRKHLGRPH